MKTKLFLFITMLTSSLSAVASVGPTNIPEPSVLGLFAVSAIAITVLNKIKK